MTTLSARSDPFRAIVVLPTPGSTANEPGGGPQRVRVIGAWLAVGTLSWATLAGAWWAVAALL